MKLRLSTLEKFCNVIWGGIVCVDLGNMDYYWTIQFDRDEEFVPTTLGSLLDEWEWLQSSMQNDNMPLKTDAAWIGNLIVAIGNILQNPNCHMSKNGKNQFRIKICSLLKLCKRIFKEIREEYGEILETNFDLYSSISSDEMFNDKEPFSINESFVKDWGKLLHLLKNTKNVETADFGCLGRVMKVIGYIFLP